MASLAAPVSGGPTSTATMGRGSRITILPATPPAFPALATADLLAFSGVSGEQVSRLISPLRRALVQSNTHPRHWPDFQASIDSLQRALRDGKVMVMAVVDESGAPVPPVGSTILYGRGEQSKGSVSIDGVTGVAVGLAKLRPPKRVRQALLSSRTITERLWGDYVTPAVKKVQHTVYGDDATGADLEFYSRFKGEMERVRKEMVRDEDWILEFFFVHPAYHGRGIARALLEHCQTLAQLANPLAFPYPSLYAPKALSQPVFAQASTFLIGSSSSPIYAAGSSLENAASESLSTSAVIQQDNSRTVRITLEASRAGTPVYTKLGFRQVSRSTIEYKGEQVSWPVMLWEGHING